MERDKKPNNKKQYRKKPRSCSSSKTNGKPCVFDDKAPADDYNAAKKSPYNDISWYSHNPQMLRDSASFSFNAPLGNQLPVTTLFGTGTTGVTLSFSEPSAIPGLMSMRFTPTIGVSTSSTSPVNLAAQNIYAYVRYMNSGAKNYDQADLMLYLLAMDSVYMMWNWLKRMYGYARTYSPINRYMPRAYAAGDGIDFDDLISHLADYRAQLNGLAARIQSFCVPAVMPYFIRHSWMVSNLYKDSENAKAQQYMWVPHIAYKYDETTSQYGGQLVAQNLIPTNAVTMQYIINTYLIPMLDAIGYSEDIGVMSGDILKAYGQDRLFKITPLEPDYVVEPVYNEEVLNQMHNSQLCELSSTIANYNITQDPTTGFLLYNPIMGQGRVTRDGILFNVPWDNPTADDVMIGTRLTTTIYNDGTNYRLGAVGSEFISARNIWKFDNADTLSRIAYPEYITISDTSTSTAATREVIMRQFVALSNFDWHPLTPVWHVTGTTATAESWKFMNWLGDVTNYTVITAYELRNLHSTALLSLFNVPQLGSF